jgi:glutamine amidotransferase
MQLLASSSEENGIHEGLDLIPGRVRRLDSLGCTLRIPHVGWNEVSHNDASPLLDHIPQGTDFYFVHSYAFDARHEADVVATVSYGVEVVAALQKDRCFGTQFHPEKSSRAGWQVLRNFLDYVPPC